MNNKKVLLLSLCIGLMPISAVSQSKLQGAGKASKVGASTTTKIPTTNAKPSSPKKSTTPSAPVKRNTNNSAKYASMGYMEIQDVSFANADADNTIIDNYDSKLYAKEVKYLTPRIAYKGLASQENGITLSVKLYDEDGKLKTGTGSPEGFTYNTDVKVEIGSGKYIKLPGWGNPKGGSYNAGLYKMEIWYKDNMLYQKEIRLYSGTTPIVSNNILSISSISFANTDKDGKIISDYGQTLYDGKVQYLKPKIYYNGKYSNNQDVTLYVRYFKSSGELVSGSSSPVGFSFKESVTIKPGSNSIILSGFGNEAATNYKEGTCKVEIWMDGEKLYETDVPIKNASSSYGTNNSGILKSIIESPMGKGNCDPTTATFYAVKNSLSSIYNVDDSSDSDKYTLHLRSSDNSSTQSFIYQGLPFDRFYFMISKNSSSSLKRRMSYDFEINKARMGSLEDAYACMDRIVRDFKDIGIIISYEKKNETYTKAKGSIRNGNIEYEISMDEFTSNFKFTIDVWVWK